MVGNADQVRKKDSVAAFSSTASCGRGVKRAIQGPPFKWESAFVLMAILSLRCYERMRTLVNLSFRGTAPLESIYGRRHTLPQYGDGRKEASGLKMKVYMRKQFEY